MNKGTSPQRKRRLGCSQTGAHMVELAIAIPLFLGLVFGVIDMARVVAGYSTVRSAVATGVRRGAVLGRTDWQAVKNLFDNAPGAAVFNKYQTTKFDELNAVPEFASDASLAPWYVAIAEAQCGSQNSCFGETRSAVQSLYRFEVQAIAYANIVLRRNLGAIRYPCRGEPGCARCFTVRGDSADYFGSFVKTVGLRCDYDVPLTTTIVALGWLPRIFTVSSKNFMSVDGYPDTVYHPASS